MATLAEHPAVKRAHERAVDSRSREPLDAVWLRELCLSLGADDVGFVEIGRAELAAQKQEALSFFPAAQSLISIVCRMNREPIRTTARSVANLEFHHTHDLVNDTCHRIVSALEAIGVRAVNPAMGFPMEMDRFPGKSWLLSHKPVAVAAGLGQIGIHRNVIHPQFGNFILLGTVVVDALVTQYSRPIEYNPCLTCKLCVAACPVGAISPEGDFNFSACYTHNYREFMGGFNDWVGAIAESGSRSEYRKRVTDAESASMWQSLSFGPSYKAAYCMAVCPAGDDVIGPFLADRKRFTQSVLRPLQEKEETIYVMPGSDAEAHVARRFPRKKTRRVGTRLRSTSIQGFLRGLSLLFQRETSAGVDLRYHFTFTGDEESKATVVISGQKLQVEAGHSGKANLGIHADSQTWLGFLAGERSLVWALVLRKIRLRGNPRHLRTFARCFAS